MSSDRFTDPSFFQERPWLEYLFILSACLGQLFTQNATTDALTHMNQLVQDFHSPETMKPWFMASFGLSVGTMILISGQIGDVYGIHNVILGGYVWTVVWSILTGISYYDRHAGASMYICCRTFQGVGIAFILPNVIGAVGRIYKTGLRKKIVFALIALAAPLGGVLGPFMSGVIAVRTRRWDWNYYAFAIACAVGGIVTYISVPILPPKLREDGKSQKVDWIGGGFAISAMTLFNFSWNQAPVVGWDSPYIITLLVVSIPLFVAFVLWEIKMARDPLLPKEVLGNTRVMGTLLVLFFAWGSFGINIYHLLTLLQDFRHYSPFAAGSALWPAPPMGAIASLSCALLMTPNTVELIMLGSTLCFTATGIVLATADIHESYWRNTFGAWILAPFGMDWSFPAGTILLSEELPPRLQGLAGSLVTVMVNYGISIFLGVAGTVEDQLQKQRPDDSWRAWRGAEYFSIGMSGLAACVAGFFVVLKFWPGRHHGVHSVDEKEITESDDFEKAGETGTSPPPLRSYSVSPISTKDNSNQ